MPKTKIKSTGGYATLTLYHGGSRHTRDDEVNIEATKGFDSWYFNGPALRDALLEAFPLPKEEPLADWEKELLAGVTPGKKPDVHDVVPGTVLRSKHGFVFTALPNDDYYDNTNGVVERGGGSNWGFGFNDVVFDPRDAKALPSPLGIRVGDRVERTKNGITVSFEVGLIEGVTGHLHAKGASHLDVGYDPKEFRVTSREVPDRLPAGAIVRLPCDGIRLITNEGGIHLTGYVNSNPAFRDASDYAAMVKRGYAEVIYLP